MPLTKQGDFAFNHADQQDDLYKVMSATEIKAAFDSRATELKNTINNLIDALNSAIAEDSGADGVGVSSIDGLNGNTVQSILEDLKELVDIKSNSDDVFTKLILQSIELGNSGADKIGATPIDTSPANVQGILEWLKNQMDSLVLGQIPDGAVTPEKLSFDVATETELNAVKLSVSDGKIIVKNAITGRGGTVLDADGDGIPTFSELESGVNSIVTETPISGTAVVGDVLAPKTFYNTSANTKLTGTMPSRGAMSITPGTSNQVIPAGYHNGSGIVQGDPDLIAANILEGKNIFGVLGSLAQGKKFATGLVTSAPGYATFTDAFNASVNLFPITVSGLTFKPSTVLILTNDELPYHKRKVVVYHDLMKFSQKSVFETGVAQDSGSNFIQVIGSAYVSTTGFNFGIEWQNRSLIWFAYE